MGTIIPTVGTLLKTKGKVTHVQLIIRTKIDNQKELAIIERVKNYADKNHRGNFQLAVFELLNKAIQEE